MSRHDLVRGFSGVLLASLWVGTACSSSDGPKISAGGDAGTGLATGGASAGAPANGGKGGKGGNQGGISGSASGGDAGAETGGDAGAATGGDAGAATGGHAAAGSGGRGGEGAGSSAGTTSTAGAGPAAGSGGEPTSGCSPNNDQCPAGQYCSPANTCVAGCKNGDSCASGVCSANHDCQNCVSDQECSESQLCGASQCAAACTAEQEGGNPGCGVGLTCCSLHCVSTLNDQQHCGACGTACTASQFCASSGCVTSQFSALCQVGKIVVILDGQTGDDPTSRALAQTLVDHCPSSQTVREGAQTATDALNPVSGRPVSGSDELLVMAGGSYFQKSAGYLETNKSTPVYNVDTHTTYEIRDSSNDALIVSEPISEASNTNDIFVVQFVRDPSSGSLALNAYGFTVGGTAAATYYFEHAIASDFASATKAWYVGKWTDMDEDEEPDLNEFTIIASGG